MIQIEQIRTGVIQENCYLVYNEEALLIIEVIQVQKEQN